MAPNLISRTATILLVEDNDAHAELIEGCLLNEHNVRRIYRVTDGESALDYLYQRNDFADPDESPRPDLILLDLRLPKIDGLEVLNEIKNADELRRIPVVILSTSNAEHDVSAAYNRNANSYLAKPIEFEALTDMLSSLSCYWLNWNQSPNTFTSG